MLTFSAKIFIIGVNPYVLLPDDVLHNIMKQAKKEKGPIPVKGTLQGKPFIQTLVKFQGAWRLYLNTPMRTVSQTKVGDTVTIEIEYDPIPRIVEMPDLFSKALNRNKIAKETFEKLPPYRQKEINRYLANLKNEDTLKYNVEKTIQFLSGKKTTGVLYR